MVEPKLSKAERIKQAKEYDNSRPIDVWKVSDYPEVKCAVDHVNSELNAAEKIKPQYKKKYRDTVRAVILDLFVAHYSDPLQYIGYSRNRNKYKSGSRYKALFFTYRPAMKVIDFLIKHGYAEGPKGINRKIKPVQARLRANEKLINLVKIRYNIKLQMIKRNEAEELIILRDENKNYVEYEDTDDTNQMRENLKLINRNLEKHAILLYVKDSELRKINKILRDDFEKVAIDFTRKRLRRKFNNCSFSHGGRFYDGWWQNIPREYRSFIRVNDKDVVELDYKGLHIYILYARKGLQLPLSEDYDPYEIDGYSHNVREFAKQLLLRLINADSVTSAIRSIKDRRNPNNAIEIPNEVHSVEDLVEKFLRKHSPIRNDFGQKDLGVKLQFYDSQISEKVMLQFAEMGYPILPIHDSFIIHHALEAELKESMKEAFFEMFNLKCKVDLKYRSIEKRQKSSMVHPDICEDSLQDLLSVMSENGEYGTYFKLLNQHRKSLDKSSAAMKATERHKPAETERS